jgi:four helix bundle protein
MMKIERFEDIIAWQKAKELSVQVYGMFENSKDFGFKDQIQRASVSVMNNIAEGFERRGNKEFRHFLYNSQRFLR